MILIAKRVWFITGTTGAWLCFYMPLESRDKVVAVQGL
nr:hypothetical protein [Escherichia coli O25b:H4-ST131]